MCVRDSVRPLTTRTPLSAFDLTSQLGSAKVQVHAVAQASTKGKPLVSARGAASSKGYPSSVHTDTVPTRGPLGLVEWMWRIAIGQSAADAQRLVAQGTVQSHGAHPPPASVSNPTLLFSPDVIGDESLRTEHNPVMMHAARHSHAESKAARDAVRAQRLAAQPRSGGLRRLMPPAEDVAANEPTVLLDQYLIKSGVAPPSAQSASGTMSAQSAAMHAQAVLRGGARVGEASKGYAAVDERCEVGPALPGAPLGSAGGGERGDGHVTRRRRARHSARSRVDGGGARGGGARGGGGAAGVGRARGEGGHGRRVVCRPVSRPYGVPSRTHIRYTARRRGHVQSVLC